MPILLQPTPRRLHRTRENFALSRPVRLALPPGADPELEETLRQELEELFLLASGETEAGESAGLVRFALLGAEAAAEVPEGARGEALRLQVEPEVIHVEAGAPVGWLRAARMLRGLRERDELVGLTLLDWPSFPVRQVDLPWPAAGLSEAALLQWLRLMAAGRFNRLGLPADTPPEELPAAVQTLSGRLGVEIGEPSATLTGRLIPRPSVFPLYSQTLPALLAAAEEAEASGTDRFVLAVGAVDAQTSLEALVYGLFFAGDCAWNPRKADLKAHRRWYSARRFGLDSRAPLEAVDELEAGARLVESMTGAARLPEGTSGSGAGSEERALETEDPFDTASLAGVAQPEEQAAELERRAAAAMAALAPLQPDSEERAAALQGMQWTAQRLRMLGRRLAVAEQVREVYRAAYVALASPRAVSQRLLRAADVLETAARAFEEHRAEWHALWRRERQEPYDPESEAALRRPAELFQARAARLKLLRDRYIQTGSLPSPAEEGLERTGSRLAEGISPGRLPPQPSPAWWPEGGAARMQIEVDCPDAAAGMPWEVQVDFRALAGETGAFNVRSARLVPLTEADEAGPEQPCQLLRAGIVFIPEPGQHTHFLYLDPQPGTGAGFRETRAGQSRSGVRLENRRMQLRLSPVNGFVRGWRLMETGTELLPAEPDSEEQPVSTGDWRLRVIETGPLLARARAEHPDGTIRQFDLLAGQPWTEISVNAPWPELLLPTRSELWTEGAEALLGSAEGVERHPLTEENSAAAGAADWVALHRSQGLTLGLLSDSPAGAEATPEHLKLAGPSRSGSVLLFAGWESDPEVLVRRLQASRRQPPRVRLGIIEERRVREF